jgi:hypothetical protein
MNEYNTAFLKSQFKDPKRKDMAMTEEEYRLNKELIEEIALNPGKSIQKGFLF